MEWVNRLAARLRAVLRRDAVIGDIEEELRVHVEMETETLVARGMKPSEARAQAQRTFGHMGRARERAYEVRGGGLLESVLQDLAHGIRMFASHKTFTAVAVLTLALGIGANTAIFSVVNELLLRPLPYHDAGRLVTLWEITPEGRHQNTTSRANFLAWREHSRSFENMAAFADERLTLTGGEPEEVPVQLTTPELFGILGVRPMMGRGLTRDAAHSRTPIVVLSYGIWQRRFGGDPHIVGRTLTLNGALCTITGVMPRGFEWHLRQRSRTGHSADIWAILAMPTSGPATIGRFLSVVARLKPGVSIEQARSELSTIHARIARGVPEYNRGYGAEVIPLREQFVGNVRSALWILLGAVGFVLLVACANVANLLLARGATREKEIALRTALGAGRMRVVRQLLTESLLLAVVGGVMGLALAYWGIRALVAISPSDVVNLEGVGLHIPVLLWTCGLSLATGVIFGVGPALEAARLDLNEALKEGGPASGVQPAPRSRTLRGMLVVGEIALALILLTAAGLMVRSFARLQDIDTGFKSDNLLTMVLRVPGRKYANDQQMVGFFRQVTERIRALPGVRSAGLVNYLPLYGGLGCATSFTIHGRPTPRPGEEPGTNVRVADSSYFRTMAIPLLRGRTFNEFEQAEPRRVVVISESLARQYFANEDPLGRRIEVAMFEKPTPADIVGVVGDVRYDSLTNRAEPTVYFPPPDLTYESMTLVIRTAGDPAQTAPDARRIVRAIDPEQPVSDVRTMNQVLGENVSRARFNTLLLAIFAGVATLLAAVGIFGVMNYSVTLRTREIGLRTALGADPDGVLMLIMRRGLTLTVMGVVSGLIGAAALTRVMSGLLYGVGATDPATFAGIALLLTAVSLLACYIPARRATRVDPIRALRGQ